MQVNLPFAGFRGTEQGCEWADWPGYGAEQCNDPGDWELDCGDYVLHLCRPHYDAARDAISDLADGQEEDDNGNA